MRVAEPHIYGMRRDGVTKLLVYHVDGDDPARWFEVAMSDFLELEVLEQRFAGRRSLPPELDPDLQKRTPSYPR